MSSTTTTSESVLGRTAAPNVEAPPYLATSDLRLFPQVPPLPWHSSATETSRGMLLLGDLASFGAAIAGAVLLRQLLLGRDGFPWPLLGGGAVWFALRWEQRLYSPEGMTALEEFRRTITTTLLAAFAHAAMLFVLQDRTASRFLACVAWALVLPMSWLMRVRVKRLLRRLGLFGKPVVIIGAGHAGALIIEELASRWDQGLFPVAAFDDDPAKIGKTVGGVPVIGSLRDAEYLRLPYPVRDAIIALPSVGGASVVRKVNRLARRYPNVSVVSEFFGLGTSWVETGAVGKCLTLRIRHERFERRSLRIKRAFDLMVGVPVAILALPVIALAALATKIASRGPAFFCQEREGLEGRRVRIWKIRTMVADAESRLERYLEENADARAEWHARMKLSHDPRIVPVVGRFLRRSSVDELPQIWNVLRGELSLVGPRPFPDYHLASFDLDFRDLRRQVPPGITGYWQIMHRSDSNLHTQEASDSYYIHNWSLWLDLWILAKTATAVLSRQGAY